MRLRCSSVHLTLFTPRRQRGSPRSSHIEPLPPPPLIFFPARTRETPNEWPFSARRRPPPARGKVPRAERSGVECEQGRERGSWDLYGKRNFGCWSVFWNGSIVGHGELMMMMMVRRRRRRRRWKREERLDVYTYTRGKLFGGKTDIREKG